MELTLTPEEALRQVFGPAFEQLNGIVDSVAKGDADGWTHDKMESWVGEKGRELKRLVLQGMFDARRLRETKHTVVVGADRIERTERRDRTRVLATPVGEVKVTRIAYSAPEEGSLMPLDAELALPAGLYSDGMKKEGALEVIRGSFEDAQRSITRHTGVEIPKRQLIALVRSAATDFEDFYRRQYVVPEEALGADSLLIMSCDGKGVVMRPEGLRDATREAAEAATHKLKGRLSKGEKTNRKRMATVATVYDITPLVRQPEEILDPEAEAPARPRPTNKRVWARLDVSMDQVVKDLFDEADRRDPSRKRRWVALVDGANHQLKLIRREARRRKVELTIVVDLIHVLEYLWRAAWDFFEEGDIAAEGWVVERALEVLRGKAPFVAAGIRRSATLRQLEKRKNADECADYLLRKKEFLRYDEALSAGLPIATGVIEGACRHLVKDRMDITGARWGLDGGEAVLRLRSLWSSGDFDAYWEFHLEQTHDRNYGDDYVLLAA